MAAAHSTMIDAAGERAEQTLQLELRDLRRTAGCVLLCSLLSACRGSPLARDELDLAVPAQQSRASNAVAAIGGGHVAVRSPAPEGSAKARCPAAMVEARGFCIDRYEAHLVRRLADGSLVRHPHSERPTELASLFAESAAGVLPQGYISRVEAARTCENAGKRLCTLSEWYRACRGAQNTTFPYGEQYVTRRCNVGRPHLLSLMSGADPRAWAYERDFNNPELNRKPGFLAPTGQFSGCVSDFGVHDMVGNLHEWVADRVDASLARKLPLESGIRRALPRSTGKGIFMGGFYSTRNEHGRGCNYVTAAHEPAYHDYSTGFRCCRDLL